MQTIVCHSPAISSLNLGDEIIAESAKQYLKRLFPADFFVDVSTHLPLSKEYMWQIRHAAWRFVLGSNLLRADIQKDFRQWDVRFGDEKFLHSLVLVGCGWWIYQDRVPKRSAAFYRKILSPDLLHSVRDEYTKEKLLDMGIENVVNTGCPTMWGFTESFCAAIPGEKAEKVVTTLTDYRRAPEEDAAALRTLLLAYESVHLWLQGARDFDYFTSLPLTGAERERIALVPPSLAAYDRLLTEGDAIDYCGTRLHGGIRALQKGRRAIIIAVDNRALELHRSFQLPILERGDSAALQRWLTGHAPTRIRIPQDEIHRFLSQFR